MGFSIYPGATNRVKEFTSSGTFVCPSGVYSAKFLVVGAGGAGGGTTQLVTEYAVGGGGGGGAVKEIDLALTPGTSYTITIGAKGSGASGTVGGSGGFSEVLNGATSLIKCFGGSGGTGNLSGGKVYATTTQTIAGGGGDSASGAIERAAGGGGGSFSANAGTSTGWQTTLTSGEGYPGKGATNFSSISPISATGGAGINGYGAGGGGALVYTAPLYATTQGGSSFAGNGAARATAGTSNGTASIANTGCGGGGSAAFLNATATTGGNGSDGLVRVVYFA